MMIICDVIFNGSRILPLKNPTLLYLILLIVKSICLINRIVSEV